MPRSIPLELRVTPEVAAAIGRARGLVPLSTWLEDAALRKLHGSVAATPDDHARAHLDAGPPPEPPPMRAEHEWPRRPPPRLTGGRGKR